MKTVLWQTDEFVTATGGRLIGDITNSVNGVSIDSRTLEPNDAFFAIKGDRFDGHEFVEGAFSTGASVAVVSEDKLSELPAARPYVVVNDVLAALTNLGKASRNRSKAQIVAVTGSVGKTGTKEALGLALSKSGRTHKSIASYNNHWGVPLSLARMPADCEFGVFEIGMNAPGEIEALSNLVRPHIAIITAVGEAHLQKFGSIEEIAKAKAEIFSGLEPGGIAVLNADCEQTANLLIHASNAGVGRVVQFGSDSNADSRLVKSVAHASCTCVTAKILGNDVIFKVGAPGRHLIGNSLAVLATVNLIGANLAKGALALSELQLPKGRGDRWKLKLPNGQALLIDESYNANPLSMSAAIKSLVDVPVRRPGRHLAVLGDMLELGATTRTLHESLANLLEEAEVDLVHCVGPEMRNLWNKLPRSKRGMHVDESSMLEPTLADEIRPGDVIMIKGSLGSKMAPLVDVLKQKFAKQQMTMGG